MLEKIVSFILQTTSQLGYPGIILLMALESSFFPFPSEVIIPPAAYLAAKGEFNIWLVIASGILGSLLGAWFNYFLAMRLGRPALQLLILRYGKFFFLPPDTLLRMEKFFAEHGHISTFVGRLIPGVRQYISLPAGLGRMNLALFSFYTGLGAGIWVCILAAAGYLIGANEALLKEWLHRSSAFLILFSVMLVTLYVYFKRRR
ncbi:SNARE associated Golgi protein-like protein [Thermodesulfatator indicus DSM 15286]|uniref:SNARE associated Golgi protein-like protein n=1 Tax=Thermodesulfatator indicus (strain DSM 15286 / JCM 11887 / CIR29812) TaxID=667014 RepID=F8ABH5_THEID|nr:DedA family protein [Thermodesulfatator indicus]AEH44492.1 SNARE associated Golgi protein-like protein [Thermodesulfatator indicus DSM 15286]